MYLPEFLSISWFYLKHKKTIIRQICRWCPKSAFYVKPRKQDTLCFVSSGAVWFSVEERSDFSYKSTVSPSSSFPKLPGPGSPMRSFSAFLVFLLLVLLIFHLYCLLSHPYTLFSLFLCWRMSCPPTVQTNLLCWGSLLRQRLIFNQMFCKQKEYSFSRTLLTRTFLWLSLLSDFISTGISVSPKRVQTVHGVHSIAALLLPSLLSLDAG